MSFIPFPAWPNTTYSFSSDFLLPFTKLSIWIRDPQSLLYLLLIILSTLHYEYLSFLQPLPHQLESTLWEEQGLVAFHF